MNRKRLARGRIVVALIAVTGLLAVVAGAPAQPGSSGEGARLYADGCSSCHGPDLRGIAGRGPNLRGVGAAAADFYLRTGRMPLAEPGDQPTRSEPPYSDAQIHSLVEYIGSFGGPPIPRVAVSQGDLAKGRELFIESCAGCHQAVGEGGIPAEGIAPDLKKSSPVDVAEAIEVAPYLMPSFRGRFSDKEIASIARYVEYTKDPDDRGGWGIGHIGPVPEGMVAWLLAGAALVLVVRLTGERSRA
jgi:ubiquinol-cytochrome c reductase cytochrome c subunit